MFGYTNLPPLSKDKILSNLTVSAITTTLKGYETALNTSSTSSVLSLYTADGVFMPQNFPTAIGTSAITEAYNNVFAAITLSVEFNIIEIMPVADNWAFARTSSAGKTLIKATGDIVSEANQELFVMQKVEGTWKIARYCFSTTSPPH